jgi:hypothetical protein
MSTHTLTIDNWHPARLNSWDGRHWSARARAKKNDAAVVALLALQQGLPKAVGKRRVTLRLTLAKGQRAGDPDAYWKSLCDALKHARLLVDDNRQHCVLEPVVFERGPRRKTVVTLEDIV